MRSRLLAAVLAALVAGIGLAQLGLNSAAAQTATPIPGLNFWIGIDGVTNCSTQQNDASCDLAPGSTFVIDVHFDPLPSSVPSYGGFDVKLQYSEVTANQDASTDSWPDCSFPASSYDTPGTVVFACAVGIAPAPGSTYSGIIGTNSFVCSQSGSVTLVHGLGNTDIVEFDKLYNTDAESIATSDKITINCVQGGVQPPPITPRPGATSAQPITTLEPTAAAKATSTAQSQSTATAEAVATAAKKTPSTSGEDGGGDGLAGWVIAVIVVGGVAAAGVAGVVGWRVMQSRGGGGTPPA